MFGWGWILTVTQWPHTTAPDLIWQKTPEVNILLIFREPPNTWSYVIPTWPLWSASQCRMSYPARPQPGGHNGTVLTWRAYIINCLLWSVLTTTTSQNMRNVTHSKSSFQAAHLSNNFPKSTHIRNVQYYNNSPNDSIPLAACAMLLFPAYNITQNPYSYITPIKQYK